MREIKEGLAPTVDEPVRVEWTTPPESWLAAEWRRRCPDDGIAWFLGFADDGLVWGRLAGGQIETAWDTDLESAGLKVGAPLRAETLWRAHVFATAGELRLWRDGSAHHCIWITDAANAGALYHDEARLLVGQDTAPAELPCGRTESGAVFTLLRGTAGEVHAPPLDPNQLSTGIRLWVRHYLAPDGRTGMLEVNESRIIGFAKERQ